MFHQPLIDREANRMSLATHPARGLRWSCQDNQRREKMTIGQSGDYETLTVTGSAPVARPDGAGILLETQERGSIVFSINLQGIVALREALATAEQMILLGQNQSRN
jgi:hypothetical protein